MIRNVLYATLEKKGIPIKFDEARKIAGDDDNDIPRKTLQISQKSNLDRNSILERLKQNNRLVTYCKVPDKNVEEASIETEEDTEKEMGKKESILLLEEDDEEENEKEEEEKEDNENKEENFFPEDEEEEEEKDVPMPQENPDNMEIDKTESKSVFVICAKTKAAPGTATGEDIAKPDNFKELGLQEDWRGKLCNSYPIDPFEIEDIKWTNVHHYLIYAKFKPKDEFAKQSLIESYETAVAAEKTGFIKGKNEKGKTIKIALTIDPEFESIKSNLIYHALYVKFSTNIELMKILYLTYPAKLTARQGKDIEDFKELEVLRSQFMPFFRSKFGKEVAAAAIPPKNGRKGKDKDKNVLLDNNNNNNNVNKKYSEEDLKKVLKRLPKREQIIMRKNEYYMYNRMNFHRELKTLFNKHEKAVKNGDDRDVPNELLIHQRVVSEYLNLYTPYRGLLIYHGLGSGKTFTSVAIAEGMKTSKHVVVLLPASLHFNYVAELEKFGDPLYRFDQYWEFVKTEGKEELIGVFAKALSLSTEYVRENGGAYLVDVSKPSNFTTLSADEQEKIRKQIIKMIEQKYSFIHYNAGQTFAAKLTDLGKQKGQENPFDHSVVIIDEAHNLISNIKNNLNNKTATTNRLYKLLMSAQDVRIVLLSGTPVVNHPFEMAIIYNILRGNINTWEMELSSKKDITSSGIENILDKNGLNYYDFIDYSRSTHKLQITKNPFGFVNKVAGNEKKVKGGFRVPNASTLKVKPVHTRLTRKRNEIVGGSQSNYAGVKFDPSHVPSEKDFISRVVKTLETNEFTVTMDKKKQPVTYLALPNSENEFTNKFVKLNDASGTGDILNRDTLHKRILGLTSYFRSPKEGMLPDFIYTEDGEEYHNVFVEMSDTQFESYVSLRTEERNLESKAKKREKIQLQKANGQNNHEILKSSGNYRSSTRQVCNYAVPTNPGRPKNIETELADGEEDGDDEEGGEELPEKDKNENRKENKKRYVQDITRVTQVMRDKKNEFFSDEALAINSPKFKEMISRIFDEKHKGPHLVYSDFLNMEGIEFFKIALETRGMRELKIEKSGNGGYRLKGFDNLENAGDLCYITYTGEGEAEERDMLRNIYNSDWKLVPDEISDRLRKISDTNKYGNIVKVIMITRAGAEGINLKNTRFVHIMEPYWHKTRIDQVVGRARRIGSHLDLEPELRNVQVFQYISVFSEKQKAGGNKYIEIMQNDISKIDGKSPVTTDQYLYELSLMKQRLIDQFLEVIKESAVDCRVYRSIRKNEDLVCYGSTKEHTVEFSSHPQLQWDIDNKPVTPPKKQIPIPKPKNYAPKPKTDLPPATKPSEPPATKPSEPPATKPSEPPTTKPSEPPTTKPSEPAPKKKAAATKPKEPKKKTAVAKPKDKPAEPLFKLDFINDEMTTDMYDEDIVFCFYSKSAHLKPGKGAGEKIPDNKVSEYSELAKIKDWRKMLSNFYVKAFELDGKRWNSVEHYYQGSKFKKENPEYYNKFSLDSKSDICEDPALAKTAGGKNNKQKVKADSDFFSTNRVNEEMYAALVAKFKDEELSKMLRETKQAKLMHTVLRQTEKVFFQHLIVIRSGLLNK